MKAGPAVRRINRLHAAVEHHCRVCSNSVHAGLKAAWEAGRLLREQKREIVHGNWQLWLEKYFDGTVRTAQRYMALAKAVPDVSELEGCSLRQAYLRLGIAVAERAGGSRCVVLPAHALLVNRFRRWLRQTGDTAVLPEAEKQTLRRDMRPVYDWLARLFADDAAQKRS